MSDWSEEIVMTKKFCHKPSYDQISLLTELRNKIRSGEIREISFKRVMLQTKNGASRAKTILRILKDLDELIKYRHFISARSLFTLDRILILCKRGHMEYFARIGLLDRDITLSALELEALAKDIAL